MARYFIERTPNSTGTIYEVYSEEHTLFLKIAADRAFTGWQLNYYAAEGSLSAFVPLDSLNFTFEDASGHICGYVREASFSVMGKSIVEDEHHNPIGFIKAGMRPKIKVCSMKEEILARLTRNREKKAPVFLRPSRAHLLRRYILQTVSDTLPDNRLVFCIICLLIAEEWQSSAG